MGAVTPAARSRAAFSCRDSPSATAPPASIALPTSGAPHVHLVTPTTSTPSRARITTRVFAVILPGSIVSVACPLMTLPSAGPRERSALA